jgi:single-strand DNA-binding protein
MKGINKAILLGIVGQDVEFKNVSDNFSVANFSLATTRSYKDKSGDWVDKTEWHNIVCYNKMAEIAQKAVTKGSKIYVEGQIETKSWDKDGVKQYRTEINADTISVIAKKGDGASTGNDQIGDDDSDDLPF